MDMSQYQDVYVHYYTHTQVNPNRKVSSQDSWKKGLAMLKHVLGTAASRWQVRAEIVL